MLVEMLMVLGLMTSFQPGDSCIDALHEMRVMERMRIQSTDVLEDNAIAYTLTDGPRISSKTAILVCRRDVEEEDLDETGTDEAGAAEAGSDEDEMAPEDGDQEEDLEETDDEVEPLEEDDEESAE